jgi:hypothetical protein
VHQANERVLRTSNKIAQKTSSFYFTYYIVIIAIYKHTISSRDKIFHNFFIFSAGVKHLRVVQLESMPGYRYPNIDSGATPIRSAGRAPDRKTISRKNSTRREEEDKEKFEPMIDYKYPTIASGATPIGSAGRAPDEELLQ